jgi:hypothetical protein
MLRPGTAGKTGPDDLRADWLIGSASRGGWAKHLGATFFVICLDCAPNALPLRTFGGIRGVLLNFSGGCPGFWTDQ